MALGHASRGLLDHVNIVGELIEGKCSFVGLEVESLAMSLLEHDWHCLSHAILLQTSLLHVKDVAVLLHQGLLGPDIYAVKQLLGTGQRQVLSLVQFSAALLASYQTGSLVHQGVRRNGPQNR